MGIPIESTPPTEHDIAVGPQEATVSVVVTCFNGDQWIASCLDSVLAQTCSPLEIIVVDDASEDSSVQILQDYERRGQIHLIRHGTNRGIPATKNTGLRATRGRYVAFLEQDDEWYADKLACQVETIESDPRLGMVFARAVCVDEDGRQFLSRPSLDAFETTEGAVKAFFTRNPVTSMSSVLFRRQALDQVGGFDESYGGGDDYDLFLRLAGRHMVAHSDRPLLRYRIHRNSFSYARLDRMLMDQLRVVERAVLRYPFLAPLKSRRLASLWVAFALRFFETGSTIRGIRAAFRALAIDPLYRPAFVALAVMSTGGLGRTVLRHRREILGTKTFGHHHESGSE